jgi:hypothetical protein
METKLKITSIRNVAKTIMSNFSLLELEVDVTKTWSETQLLPEKESAVLSEIMIQSC